MITFRSNRRSDPLQRMGEQIKLLECMLDYGKSLLVAAHSLVLRSISKSWHAHENNISTLILIRLHTTLYPRAAEMEVPRK